VICENFAELELSRARWLDLLDVNLFSLEVRRPKSGSGLDGAKLADRLSEKGSSFNHILIYQIAKVFAISAKTMINIKTWSNFI